MDQEIVASIREGLASADTPPDVEVVVDGNRAMITVVSHVFADMSRVRKQQSVYACIDSFIKDGRLHAVTIRTMTPEEAARQ